MIEIPFSAAVLSTKRDNLGTVTVPHALQADIDTRLLYLLIELALQFAHTLPATAATTPVNVQEQHQKYISKTSVRLLLRHGSLETLPLTYLLTYCSKIH